MLLSDRRKFLAGLAGAALAGCGFEPVYKAGSAARDLKGNVRVDLIKSRDGFELLERLQTHLGSPGEAAPYLLHVELEVEEEGLAISTSNSVTRINVFGKAIFSVTRTSDAEVVYSGEVETVTAYGTTSSTIGARTARRDARKRMSQSLADKINSRMAVSARDWFQ